MMNTIAEWGLGCFGIMCAFYAGIFILMLIGGIIGAIYEWASE